MNNYDGDDERPFQAGEFDFHYSITSDSTFRSDRLARFAREETSPLEVDEVNEADKLVWREEPLPAASGSFVDIDDPQVILTTWKGAEDGRGTILRFYNTGASAIEAHVKFPQLQFHEMYWTSGTENDEKSAGPTGQKLLLSLKPHEIRTVRVLGLGLRREN
jgi:alpha-mannosidase